MKKNNIFRHELNESSQAKATLNCLTNRNKKHLKESIGEVYPDSRWGENERLNGPNGMSKTERDVLIKLEQIMPNLVQKAMTKTADHDNPDEIKKLVLSMIMQGNLMQKLGDKVGASWKEFSMGFKSEIINLVKNEFAKHEEQEETTPPWVGRKYNGGIDFDADGNLQVITPDDDEDDDYEAPPLFDSEQERHDLALACSYCLGESFIDNDGDLDDIYYAVLNVFDSTYDAPASDDYKEVIQWCKRHYQEIEKSIMSEEQEEQIFKVRTKQGIVEVSLSSEVVDAFHDNLDPRYEDMDVQAALKGINGGARLAALISGMMEQGYKPTNDEQHILELHYNAKKAVKQSQADSSNRNINAYSD